MPLVTIYVNARAKNIEGLPESLNTIRHGIMDVVKDALGVHNVVVIQVTVEGSPLVFIDISCNFRDWRAADLKARHDKIIGWVRKIMRENEVTERGCHIRISLANIEYAQI